jgi:hypothetical protein
VWHLVDYLLWEEQALALPVPLSAALLAARRQLDVDRYLQITRQSVC